MIINLIGVPINYGCDKEGVQYGPDKLREFGIVRALENNKNKVYDLGNINVPIYSSEMKYKWHEKMKYLNPVIDVNTNLAHSVYCSLSGNCFPIVMGGDHSLGMGSIAGASKYFKELAIIWVDAHGDINDSESSPTGNIHGMPLATSLGIGHDLAKNLYYEGIKIKPENVYIVGARDLDKGEIDLADRMNINLYTMQIIRQRGLDIILEEIIVKIKASNVEGVHLSFDIDVLDRSLVPGTGTRVIDGFNLEESKIVLNKIFNSKLITSMDIVELNPSIDDLDESTAKICMGLLNHIGKLL